MGTEPLRSPAHLDSGLPAAPADRERVGGGVLMPRPTAWPAVLAFGMLMLGGGLVLSYLYSAVGAFFNYLFCVLGGLLTVLAVVGWVAQLRPGHGHVLVPLQPPSERAPRISPSPREVEPLTPGRPQQWVTVVGPLRPYSTGLRGGVAGGVVMALVATLWGLFRMHSLWFSVNALAAVVVPDLARADEQVLARFSLGGLLAGLAIHLAATVTTGIFLAATLPGIKTQVGRIITGSIIIPVVWVLAVWWLLPVLSPPMSRYVSWFWFSMSQIGYGVVAVPIIEYAQAPYRQQLQESGKAPA